MTSYIKIVQFTITIVHFIVHITTAENLYKPTVLMRNEEVH